MPPPSNERAAAEQTVVIGAGEQAAAINADAEAVQLRSMTLVHEETQRRQRLLTAEQAATATARAAADDVALTTNDKPMRLVI